MASTRIVLGAHGSETKPSQPTNYPRCSRGVDATPLWLPPRYCHIEGLVAYYSFDDGTASDASGNGFHGTVNGAAYTTGLDGNGALYFDGGSDYVEFPSGTSAFILGSNARSICLWADIASYSEGGLFSYGSPASLQDFSLRTDDEWGVVRLQFYGDAPRGNHGGASSQGR